MNILVTGGAGFIGSVLVPRLLGRGFRVTVLDNMLYQQGEALAACFSNPYFSFVRGDAREADTVLPLLRKADIAIPLAAIVGMPACKADQLAAESTNTHAVQLIAQHASKAQRIIIPNTNSAYGKGGETECTEESPLNPISWYAKTKQMAEDAVLERTNAVSLRLATVFGASPRMRLDLMVQDFVYRALHDKALVVFEGHFRRNFLHVVDAARAFIHCIDRPQLRGAFNVGDSRANITKLDLCAKIKERVPEFVYVESDIGTDVDKRDYVVSNAKFEATGWHPSFSLDDGICELLKMFQMLRRTGLGNI